VTEIDAPPPDEPVDEVDEVEPDAVPPVATVAPDTSTLSLSAPPQPTAMHETTPNTMNTRLASNEVPLLER
jgi:hypothetical protein